MLYSILIFIIPFVTQANATLRQLAYCSASTEPEMSDEMITDILETSRALNKKNEVTGLLMYRKLSFMQIFEGESEAVDDTILRILKDPRHKWITILYNKDIDERSFPDWTMAYRQPDYQQWSQNKNSGRDLFYQYVYNPTGFDHPLSKRVRIILSTFEEIMHQS